MRIRPHKLAAVVLLVVAAGAVGASSMVRRVGDDNERRLLEDRATEVSSLLSSMATGYEAQLASVASIAQVTDGDVREFQNAVAGVDDGTSGSGWALLHRVGAEWEVVGTAGPVTSAASLPAQFAPGLDTAASGRFSVLGFLGEGFGRRFAMAMGRTGVGGDYVVYNESGLMAATASASAPREESPIADVAVTVYVGAAEDPANVLIAIGEPDLTKAVHKAVNIAGTDVLFVLSATKPLAGGLAAELPRILFFVGLLLALAVAVLVEMVQRRRDDAVRTVGQLEEKNRELDRALHDQQVAEEARQRLESELRQSQRLEAIGHLAGGVAHDFNNVLAAILSYADLAADGVTEPAALADLESIRHAGRRGAALTRRLLEFSRRQGAEATMVDLNERITDVAAMLSRTLGEDVALRTVLDADPATVLADPVELDQVLLNLVVNARDALPAGGAITIRTELVTLGQADVAHLAGLAEGPYVRLTVADDGAGMSPEVLEHAFEPFYTTKGRAEGTGLGLSTVYGIVQRHGGHVSARSELGRGATFEILLPMTSEEAAVAGPDAPLAAGPVEGHGHTVLLVEDEEPLRLAVRRILEGNGFEVLDAGSGPEAFQRYAAAAIDVLVTDVVLPGGVTGVDVAAAFRSTRPRLPVVYVTGYADDILDPALLDGSTASSLLSKPFADGELLAAIGAHLAVPT